MSKFFNIILIISVVNPTVTLAQHTPTVVCVPLKKQVHKPSRIKRIFHRQSVKKRITPAPVVCRSVGTFVDFPAGTLIEESIIPIPNVTKSMRLPTILIQSPFLLSDSSNVSGGFLSSINGGFWLPYALIPIAFLPFIHSGGHTIHHVTTVPVDSIPVVPGSTVPEPDTIILFATGFIGIIPFIQKKLHQPKQSEDVRA